MQTTSPCLRSILAVGCLLLAAHPALHAQQSVLVTAAGDTSDAFGGGGFAINYGDGPGFALSGDVCVGGSRDDLPGQGNQGSATVFRRAGATWTEGQTLVSSTGDSNDMFGWALATDGEVIVAGAPYADVTFSEQGTATVFRWNGSTWVEEQTLTATGAEGGDGFGSSVALCGDVAVVGARFDDVGANTYQGSVTVFRWNGSVWVEEQQLVAAAGDAFDEFGCSVDIHGNTIVVGAMQDTVGGMAGAGSATVFRWNGSTWAEEQTLTLAALTTQSIFGSAVAVSGDVIVAGAPGATAAGQVGAGSATVFRWNGASWVEQQTLSLPSPAASDSFGESVDVDGLTIAVGAPWDDITWQTNKGSVTVYRWDGSAWGAEPALNPIGVTVGDAFGATVAVDGDTVAGASPQHDVGAHGNQGMISVFKLPALPWTHEGAALAGVCGDPLLSGGGDLAAGSTTLVDLVGAAPSALAGLFLAFAGGSTPFKGGVLKPFPVPPPVLLVSTPSGTMPLAFAMPAGIPNGTELWFQWAVQDAAAVFGVSLSNAVRGVTP